VLAAHSLACLQVAHWAAVTRLKVHAALLVAPPDPGGPEFPASARGFSPVPMTRLPFRAIVVGSTSDPYATPEFTEGCARAGGARRGSAGATGGVSAAGGLGEWEDGWERWEEIRTMKGARAAGCSSRGERRTGFPFHISDF